MTEVQRSVVNLPADNKIPFLKPAYVILLVLVAFQVYLIASSEGFHKIDEGAHFINNVRVLEDPSISAGIWQRFGRVWLFALPAQLGHKAVKIFASLLFLTTILVCYKIAEKEQIPGKEWIVALVGFQPVFLDVSYTCFAEMPAALLLALSYYCLLRSAWKSSLLFASLVFLFRFEMSIFAVVVILAALRNRKFSSLPVVLIGPLTWFVFSWVMRGKVFAFVNEFIAFSRFPKYIEGATWGHYFTSATDIFGTVQIGLLVILFVSDIVRRKMSNPILYGTVAYCFAINAFASSKEMNWTGSVGDLRYLVPVAPFVGILALNGLAVVVDALRKIPFSRFVPHILSAVIIYQAVVDVKPHHLSPFEQGVMKLAVEAASDTSNTPILSNHWAATFALLGNKKLADRVTVLSRDTLMKYPRAYILWDPLIANSPFSQQKLSYADVRNDSAVTIIDSIVVGQQTQLLFLKDVHKTKNPLTRGF